MLRSIVSVLRLCLAGEVGSFASMDGRRRRRVASMVGTTPPFFSPGWLLKTLEIYLLIRLTRHYEVINLKPPLQMSFPSKYWGHFSLNHDYGRYRIPEIHIPSRNFFNTERESTFSFRRIILGPPAVRGLLDR